MTATDPADGPLDLALTEDEWAKRLARMPQRDREIVEALRAGDSPHDVAQRRGVTLKTVQRAIEKCRKKPYDGPA